MELTLIYSYYNNPRMLARQLEEWDKYPQWVKQRVEVVVTDDCSGRYSLRNHLTAVDGLCVRAFRVTRKVPWNWLACRNIGAHEARGRWLLVTDIDHVVAKWDMIELMKHLIGKLLNEDVVYLFNRVSTWSSPIKQHGNSYLMTRDMYWRVGGYNEQYSGNYWGTSGTFRRQVKQVANVCNIGIPLTLFTCADIGDAESGLPKTGKATYSKDIKTLTFPYEEIYVQSETQA